MNEYLLATRRVGHQQGVRGEVRSPWHTFLVNGLAGSPLNTASEYALIQHRGTVASIPSCHLMSVKMSFDDAKSTVIFLFFVRSCQRVCKIGLGRISNVSSDTRSRIIGVAMARFPETTRDSFFFKCFYSVAFASSRPELKRTLRGV